MADNYLENKYQALQERKAKEHVRQPGRSAWTLTAKSFRNRKKTGSNRQK